MKKLITLTALAVLAACSREAPAPDATETAAAAPAPAEVMAADGLPVPGKYKITTDDGTVFMEDLKADGTYVQTDANGKVVETGKWDQKSAEQYCYQVDAEYVTADNSADQVCNEEGIGADGKWFSTGPDGKTATVERVPA